MIPAAPRRFAWALGISLLAHLLLTFGPAMPLPERRADTILKVTLAPQTLPPPAPARPAHRPRRAAPQPLARPLPEAPAETPALPNEEAPPSSVPENLAPSPAQDIPITLPEQAEVSYLLYKGRDGLAVGRAEHRWQREDKRYTITHVAEASGIFSLFFRGRHVQVSQGEITPSGLQPDSYWVQRGQGEDKSDRAQFDWQEMRLTFGTGSATRTVRLPMGTQDLLSFPYQLAFDPPQGGSTQLYITNGRKLDNYGYQTLGEETLALEMGAVKTLHIGKLRQEGEENTEIWLATEYHYLPVKIRFTDKQGDVIEQVAAAIKVQ